jgi:hypothetical protein
MVALANLYTILDVSIQQLAVGLAILALLVPLAWYVSRPAHRHQLSVATMGRWSLPEKTGSLGCFVLSHSATSQL